MRSLRRSVASISAIVLLFWVSVELLHARERLFPKPTAPDDESMYVTSGTALRRLSIGYSVLAADLYWIRAIQYYGGTRLRLSGQAPV